MLKKMLCLLLSAMLILIFAGCKSADADGNESDEVFEEIVLDEDGNIVFQTENNEDIKSNDSSDDGKDEDVVITTKTKKDSKETTGTEKTEVKSKAEEEMTSKNNSKCNHRWQDATCTKPSYCSRCGATKGSPIDHDTAGKTPTCTEGTKCIRCNQIVQKALGHSYKNRVCTVCGLPDVDYKKALYAGDSICYGDKDTCTYKSWGGRIERDHGIKCTNMGICGNTLSTNAGGIYKELQDAVRDNYGYIIMNGGMNDLTRNVSLGSVTPTGTTSFDTSTLAGGLEQLFSTACEIYPNAKKGFIIRYYSSGATRERFDAFVEIAKQACDKWGIPYIALCENEDFVREFGNKLSDGAHPTTEGYDIITKYVYNWMETL